METNAESLPVEDFSVHTEFIAEVSECVTLIQLRRAGEYRCGSTRDYEDKSASVPKRCLMSGIDTGVCQLSHIYHQQQTRIVRKRVLG